MPVPPIPNPKEQTNEEFDDIARRQARAFFHEMETYYGVESKDIHVLFEDLRWLHNHRAGLMRAGDWTAKAIIGMIVTGVVLAIWEGLKHVLGRQ